MAACFRSKCYWCSEDDCVITMLMVVLKLTVYPHNIQDEEEITIHHDVVDVDVEVDVVEYCCLLLNVECSGRGGDHCDVVDGEASTLGDEEALAEV